MAKTRKVSSIFVAPLAVAALSCANEAYALEPTGVDPHEPGITNGIPTGALPPPGVYVVNDLSYIDGSLKGGSGKNSPVGVNVIAWVDVPALVWSTPWHILGGQYAAAVFQPYVNTELTVAGKTSVRSGLFNSIIEPVILSWKLPANLYLSAGLPIYLKDGDWSKGAAVETANHTWTFGPSAAISYLRDGWNLTLNGEYDIQTRNNDFVTARGATTTYQSGNVINFDYTAQKTFGKWTAGLVGYWVYQTDDDSIGGTIVPAGALGTGNGAGNRFEKLAAGPSVAYDFGPISVNFRYTRDLYAKNATLNDVFWFRFALPL